jgi:hypothetical protein
MKMTLKHYILEVLQHTHDLVTYANQNNANIKIN